MKLIKEGVEERKIIIVKKNMKMFKIMNISSKNNNNYRTKMMYPQTE